VIVSTPKRLAHLPNEALRLDRALPIVHALMHPEPLYLLHLVTEHISRLARVLAARLELLPRSAEARLFALIFGARDEQLHFCFVRVAQSARVSSVELGLLLGEEKS
jgi:hypothetical protein